MEVRAFFVPFGSSCNCIPLSTAYFGIYINEVRIEPHGSVARRRTGKQRPYSFTACAAEVLLRVLSRRSRGYLYIYISVTSDRIFQF